jgi:hypothetical protein
MFNGGTHNLLNKAISHIQVLNDELYNAMQKLTPKQINSEVYEIERLVLITDHVIKKIIKKQDIP